MLRVLALQASHTVEHGRGMNRVYRAVRQQSDLLFIAASFWFEENPCVRTNTASLDRLCTLFVLSTLLFFEHIHAVFIEYACSMLHDGNDETLLLWSM